MGAGGDRLEKFYVLSSKQMDDLVQEQRGGGVDIDAELRREELEKVQGQIGKLFRGKSKSIADRVPTDFSLRDLQEYNLFQTLNNRLTELLDWFRTRAKVEGVERLPLAKSNVSQPAKVRRIIKAKKRRLKVTAARRPVVVEAPAPEAGVKPSQESALEWQTIKSKDPLLSWLGGKEEEGAEIKRRKLRSNLDDSFWEHENPESLVRKARRPQSRK